MLEQFHPANFAEAIEQQPQAPMAGDSAGDIAGTFHQDLLELNQNDERGVVALDHFIIEGFAVDPTILRTEGRKFRAR